jgi:hypothetical protein
MFYNRPNTAFASALPADLFFYLNYSVTGTDVFLNAPTKDLKITHRKIDAYRNLVFMIHNAKDTDETDGTAIDGDQYMVSTGRIRRLFKTALKYGWKFVTMPEYINMMLNDDVRRNKVAILTFDDSLFVWDTIPTLKNIFDQNAINVTTGIISEAFDFTANANILSKTLLAGNKFVSHGDYHCHQSRMTYAQFVASIENIRQTFDDANIKSPSIVLFPFGDTTTYQGKWMRNNGMLAGFTTSGGLNYFGVDHMSQYRMDVADYNLFAILEAVLNI